MPPLRALASLRQRGYWMEPLTGLAADDRQAVVRAWHQPRPCGSALVRVRESGTPTCRGASTTYANPLLLYARIAPVEGKLGHTLALSPPSRATTVKPSRWARLTQRRRSVRSALSKGDVRRACRGRKVSTQSTFGTDRKSRPSEFSSGIHRRGASPQASPQRTSRDRAVTSDGDDAFASVSTTLLQHVIRATTCVSYAGPIPPSGWP